MINKIIIVISYIVDKLLFVYYYKDRIDFIILVESLTKWDSSDLASQHADAIDEKEPYFEYVYYSMIYKVLNTIKDMQALLPGYSQLCNKDKNVVRAAGGFILADLAKRFELCILILGPGHMKVKNPFLT